MLQVQGYKVYEWPDKMIRETKVPLKFACLYGLQHVVVAVLLAWLEKLQELWINQAAFHALQSNFGKSRAFNLKYIWFSFGDSWGPKAIAYVLAASEDYQMAKAKLDVDTIMHNLVCNLCPGLNLFLLWCWPFVLFTSSILLSVCYFDQVNHFDTFYILHNLVCNLCAPFEPFV